MKMATNKQKFLSPTRNRVFNLLGGCKINGEIENEAEAVDSIAKFLSNHFEIVAKQYSISGFRSNKIDIDIGKGAVGVEVKLAKSLLSNTGELFRCVGQAVLYKFKQYEGKLIVVIVGNYSDIHSHEIDELTDIISKVAASTVTIECE